MRQAYKVWIGIAAGVFVLVAATDLGSRGNPAQPAPSLSAASATSTSATSTYTTSSAPPTSAAAAPTTTSAAPADHGELTTVTEVIDGDTIEVTGGSRVRLLGIDACEMTTPDGREAKDLLEGFISGQQVRLVADSSRDCDRDRRLLRRVETEPGSTDLGKLMVIYPTVGKWLLITAAILIVPFCVWWAWDRTQQRNSGPDLGGRGR